MDIKPPSESSEPKPTPKPEIDINSGQDNPQPGQQQKPQTPPPDLTPDPLVIKESGGSKISRKNLVAIVLICIAALAVGIYIFAFGSKNSPQTTSPSPAPAAKASAPASDVKVLQLDPSKNYGNKYANGLLPIGDGKYVTDAAKKGYVLACSQYAQNLANANGGAMTRGPWFVNNNTQYDINKKVHVQGSVQWTGSFNNTINGNTRTIVSNDLPREHVTGIFPIASKDPAYVYDRNPNSIKAQSYTFALNAKPAYANTPNCVGGTVGIMLSGVEIFSGFDAGGRDAGAWEVQDGCQGHPQEQGAYHYHTLSSCIKDVSVKAVIGFALDGFPITGPQVGTSNYLTSSDLDECHGITSSVTLDGKTVTTYHYVMTQDFPYSVACYRGQAIQPPGMQAQQQAKQQGQIPNQQPHP
jgi:hypothetical protein